MYHLPPELIHLFSGYLSNATLFKYLLATYATNTQLPIHMMKRNYRLFPNWAEYKEKEYFNKITEFTFYLKQDVIKNTMFDCSSCYIWESNYLWHFNCCCYHEICYMRDMLNKKHKYLEQYLYKILKLLLNHKRVVIVGSDLLVTIFFDVISLTGYSDKITNLLLEQGLEGDLASNQSLSFIYSYLRGQYGGFHSGKAYLSALEAMIDFEIPIPDKPWALYYPIDYELIDERHAERCVDTMAREYMRLYRENKELKSQLANQKMNYKPTNISLSQERR